MKRVLLLFVFLMAALSTIVSGTSFALAMPDNLDQTNLQTAIVTDKGAYLPTDIVVDSTETCLGPVSINVAQDASPVDQLGSGAQISQEKIGNAAIVESSGGNSSPIENVFASAIVETNTADTLASWNSSGGNFFHAGKMLASSPVGTAAGMSKASIAT